MFSRIKLSFSKLSLIVKFFPFLFFLICFILAVNSFREVKNQEHMLFEGIKKQGLSFLYGLQFELSHAKLKRNSSNMAESSPAVQERLDAFLEYSADTYDLNIAHVFVLAPTGEIIASSEPSHVHHNYVREDTRIVLKTGKAYVGDVVEHYTDPIHGLSLAVVDIAVPLRINGKTEGIIEIELDATETKEQLHNEYRHIFLQEILLLLISFLLLFILNYLFFKKLVVDRLMEIRERMRLFAEKSLVHRHEIESQDEITILSRTFDQMEEELKQKMMQIAQKQELEQEMNIARTIQKSLMGKVPEDTKEYSFYGFNRSCSETGGDFYDFFPLPHNGGERYGIAIGDISGHGVGAALLMATARSTLRGLVLGQQSQPDETILSFNTIFKDDVATGNFLSMVYGILDCSEGIFRYCNAGHLTPLVLHSGTGLFRDIAPAGNGTVLGLFDDIEAETEAIHLQKGEILILLSDGVLEEYSEDESELFSLSRLQSVLSSSSSKPLSEITRDVMQELEAFSGSESFSDDITFVMVKRK